MLKYDILAISMSNLAELRPIFHPLGHMFPVRLIMSGVLSVIILEYAAEKDIFCSQYSVWTSMFKKVPLLAGPTKHGNRITIAWRMGDGVRRGGGWKNERTGICCKQQYDDVV